MSEPTILFVKPGAISEEDKSALREAGVIVVSIDDPTSVRLVQAGRDLPTSALLAAAGKAVQASEYSQQTFGNAVGKALELEHEQK
jgi:hypothetical protein